MSAPASGNHYRFWLKLNFRGPSRTFEAGRFLLQYPQGVAALNMNLRFENGYKNHLATGYAGGAIYDNVKPPKPLAILAIPPSAKFMAASAYRRDDPVPHVPPPPQAAASAMESV